MMRTRSSSFLLPIGLACSLALACSVDEGIDDGTDDGGSEDGGDESGDDGGDGGDDGGTENEAGDSLEEASAIVFEDDSEWGDALAEDTINPAGDRDFFMIDATEGVAYLIATAADLADEQGEPDTVIRLYDADGTQIDENDDMPYRVWGTDSAVFWQATYSGPYYIEVLEYSDWAGSGATGGGSYDYELWGIESSQFYDVEPNDSAEESDALEEDGINMGRWYNLFDEDFGYMFFGQLQEADDHDYWRFEFTPEEEKGEDLQFAVGLWSSWGMDAYGFDMTLYNADGEAVAHTDAPGYDPYGGVWYSDTGIMYWVTAGETYYLDVQSNNGSYGSGALYPGLELYYYTPEEDEIETESNDTCDRADTIELTESSTTPGYFYGALFASMDGDDVADCFRMKADDVGSLDGMYFSAYVQGAGLGSLLDAKVSVYSDDTAETLLSDATEAPDTDGGDPEVWDLSLGDESNIYVLVEAEATETLGDVIGNEDGVCDEGEECEEILDDKIGNDDGVCDEDEECEEILDDILGNEDGVCDEGEECEEILDDVIGNEDGICDEDEGCDYLKGEAETSNYYYIVLKAYDEPIND